MAEADPATPRIRASGSAAALLASAFVVSTCGLIYELLASTLASYLLGDSVTQFSTVIGSYLFAMGVGSWCSRYVRRDELRLFVRVELLIALLGGCSAAALFLLFPVIDHFRVALYGLVLAIGFLVGLEIPLLIRILRGFDFRETVSNVLTFDYVGALVASLLFPLLLMPHLGMIRTGFLFGFLNAGVALALLLTLPRAGYRGEKVASVLVLLALAAGFVASDRLQRWAEVAGYGEPVIYASTTKFQRIVLTRRDDDVRLYLNGNLQFSSRDEYRYHEALVHPALGRVANPRNVLILGGGDGLAAREVFKHPEVQHLTLVDLDGEMTSLFSRTAMLSRLNAGSLTDKRMTVINADGFRWAREAGQNEKGARYDAIIIDFPDPVDYSVGKLYTDTFYRSVRKLLAPGGMIVVQSTSPLVAPNAYWTVASTLEAAGLQTRGYHVYVPSFGEWGFILAAPGPIPMQANIPAGRFLTPVIDQRLFDFPPDMARRATPVNRLDNQVLVREFADAWGKYEG